MVKAWSVILGIGLGILWIVGLGAANSTPWLSWLDALGALFAFIIAGSIGDRGGRGERAGSTVALSIGLFILWIIGLSTGAVVWQCWWTFAFACAFLILGITGGNSRKQISSKVDQDSDQFKKGA